MKIGLVHGRFQPFHSGHKHLVDKMLSECSYGVILISRNTANDGRSKANPFFAQERYNMIKMSYESFPNNLRIGYSFELSNQESEDWDLLFASCVLNLTGGHLPTDIYAGPDYDVKWDHFIPFVRIHREKERISNIRGEDIRSMIRQGHTKKAQCLLNFDTKYTVGI